MYINLVYESLYVHVCMHAYKIFRSYGYKHKQIKTSTYGILL
jgi:hypothetical protein